MLGSPAPLMSHSLGGLPGFEFSHTMGLVTGGSHGPAARLSLGMEGRSGITRLITTTSRTAQARRVPGNAASSLDAWDRSFSRGRLAARRLMSCSLLGSAGEGAGAHGSRALTRRHGRSLLPRTRRWALRAGTARADTA